MRDLHNKRALFVGDLNQGTRSLMRLQKLKQIFGEVISLSNTPVPFIAGVSKSSFLARALNKLRLPMDEVGINDSLRSLCDSDANFDVLWIEKSAMLHRETLERVRKAWPASALISISEDDMYALHNRSRYYENCISLYDVIFTTKTYNVVELKQLGGRRVELFLDSYDEQLHRPDEKYRGIAYKDIDISFVGTYEKERADSIRWLGSQGVRVVVFGNGWVSMKGRHENVDIMNYPVYGDAYVDIINRSKINLGFLRKINRDQVTSRSMEITGAGAFLLAERTGRHLELFDEGVEADFFSTDGELLEKIKKYLSCPDEIVRIGSAARKRCLHSGYGMKEQILAILSRI